MSLLQTAYLLDVIVSIPFALTMLIGNERAAGLLFNERLPESDSIRMVLGTLWTAILVCSLVGVFFPVAMSPILILQVIYKGLWLILFAVPRWLGGRATEVPWRIAGIFLSFVLIYPWVIPWAMLFASDAKAAVQGSAERYF